MVNDDDWWLIVITNDLEVSMKGVPRKMDGLYWTNTTTMDDSGVSLFQETSIDHSGLILGYYIVIHSKNLLNMAIQEFQEVAIEKGPSEWIYPLTIVFFPWLF